MEEKEYNEAVKLFSGRLYGFLLKWLKDRDNAQDMVQECFLKLWKNREKVLPEKAKSWLFTTGYHAAMNHLSRDKRKLSDDVENHANSMTQKPDNYELREVLDMAINKLPEQQKVILLLRDLEGYDYKEIGEMMNLNESQVKVYLFRARQKVKNDIKQLNEQAHAGH